ncbi:hypothetical protein COU59_01195 [Candidatus Pacearchaeota archaeon CG10_big_fil_rev_8_21_14_0_10_34_12]|nr:MAG: hypothetical protein COU59_01195 [Candidatus Pacearchaeota archaeon CG10_big_fil_rev_8_21_14_0_10_34_12]
MAQYRDYDDVNEETGNPRVKPEHKKVEFGTLEALTKSFKRVRSRLGIDKSLPWVETNAVCGYDIPKEEFDEARARGDE